MWLGTMTTVQLNSLRKAFPLQAVCVVLVLGLLSSVVFCHEKFFNCLGKRKLFQHGKDWRLGKRARSDGIGQKVDRQVQK